MADAFSASPGEIAIIGGGCYGSFYVRQLERAREKGALAYDALLVVDRDPQCQMARELGEQTDRRLIVADWGDFLDGWLGRPRGAGRASEADAIVPSPLMPHLMYEWLVRRARARWPGRLVSARTVDAEARTPYDMLAPDGTRYVSFADWICPTHCVEPALCPVIRAPRTWQMSEAMGSLAERLGQARPTAGPVLFQCRHRAFGVGMFDAAEVEAGDVAVTAAGATGAEVDVLVATISSCHGAASLLHLGAG